MKAKTTVADLCEALVGVPSDAVLHVYLGPDGIKVQAEWAGPDIGIATVLRAPSFEVRAGATCTHEVAP